MSDAEARVMLAEERAWLAGETTVRERAMRCCCLL